MPLAPGTRLGRYEIVSALGAGGMGEVYRARDTALDRTVAVKVVAAPPSRPERLERFHREARAISRLSHPHICTLFDFGEQDGRSRPPTAPSHCRRRRSSSSRTTMTQARAFAEEARAAARAQLADAPGDAQRHVLLGLALAYLGRRGEAIRFGEKGVALQPISRHAYNGAYLQHQLARIYRRAGQPDKAIDTLAGLLRIPYYLTPAWLRIDPEWESLREHPRFQKLVRNDRPP